MAFLLHQKPPWIQQGRPTDAKDGLHTDTSTIRRRLVLPRPLLLPSKPPTQPHHLFHAIEHIAQSNEDGSEKVSPPQHVVTSDGLTALLAGSDTTATVLSSIMYCLMRNPAAYKRVQEEVDKFYPVGEDSLDPKHIPEMRFLEAVM